MCSLKEIGRVIMPWILVLSVANHVPLLLVVNSPFFRT